MKYIFYNNCNKRFECYRNFVNIVRLDHQYKIIEGNKLNCLAAIAINKRQGEMFILTVFNYLFGFKKLKFYS